MFRYDGSRVLRWKPGGQRKPKKTTFLIVIRIANDIKLLFFGGFVVEIIRSRYRGQSRIRARPRGTKKGGNGQTYTRRAGSVRSEGARRPRLPAVADDGADAGVPPGDPAELTEGGDGAPERPQDEPQGDHQPRHRGEPRAQAPPPHSRSAPHGRGFDMRPDSIFGGPFLVWSN